MNHAPLPHSEDPALNDLKWLLAAGVGVSICVVQHHGASEIRLTLKGLDEPSPAWYGPVATCLASARTFCAERGIEP